MPQRIETSKTAIANFYARVLPSRLSELEKDRANRVSDRIIQQKAHSILDEANISVGVEIWPFVLENGDTFPFTRPQRETQSGIRITSFLPDGRIAFEGIPYSITVKTIKAHRLAVLLPKNLKNIRR